VAIAGLRLPMLSIRRQPVMHAMVFEAPKSKLIDKELAVPTPGPGQVLVQVSACGVCRTDLHLIDGELPNPKTPVIPGHGIVGRIVSKADGANRFRVGDRVGVPWLGYTCGVCRFCTTGRENLCDRARFTGYQIDGGYAQFTVADQRYCFQLPDDFDDVHAAPLLCAGLIGYRSFRMAGDGQRLGLYGFGAAAHIIAQVARYQGRQVYAFTKPGDLPGQEFARQLGAYWAGDSDTRPPEELDAAIIFAPVGGLIVSALQALRKGGMVVCAGIHMSDIPSFPYRLLWGERSICSVANLTRRDGDDFLAVAPRVPVATHVEAVPLSQANEALRRLKTGQIQGAAVLVP